MNNCMMMIMFIQVLKFGIGNDNVLMHIIQLFQTITDSLKSYFALINIKYQLIMTSHAIKTIK